MSIVVTTILYVISDYFFSIPIEENKNIVQLLIKAFLIDNEITNLEDSEIFEIFSAYNLTKDYELTISELTEKFEKLPLHTRY